MSVPILTSCQGYSVLGYSISVLTCLETHSILAFRSSDITSQPPQPSPWKDQEKSVKKMDGLSAAAAILQVAQMAGQAAMKAHECISVIKNAPNEISAIKNDIMSFQTLVGSLENSLSGTTVFNMVNEDPEMSEVILTLLSPIENCKIAMDRILQKMKPYLKNAGSSADSVDSVNGNIDSLSTGQTRINGVLWLFKRKEIFALSMELERTKSTFTGAMGNVNLYACGRQSNNPHE